MHASFSLANTTVMIVGASSAIGQATAEIFLAHHARLVLVDLDQSKLDVLRKKLIPLVKEPKQLYIVAHPMDCHEKRQQLMQKIFQHHQQIDVLIYAAGVEGKVGSSLQVQDSDLDEVMQINLNAPRHITQLLLPAMQLRKKGSLIFISSIAAVRGNQQIGSYALSKAALCQLVRNIAVEFGKDNIRANCILPGLVDTPFAEKLIQNPDFIHHRLAKTPLRRVGKPHEIAATALFLAADASAFMTGQSLIVDGGTTISD